MGLRNILIEGVSGVGKTSVAEELERRGHHVIHGDRVLAYYGDPSTGEELTPPPGLNDAEAVAWGNARWIWPVETVKALIANHTHPVTFFCGGSRNWSQFIALFDRVFILEIDHATLMRRLANRPEYEFGGRAVEQQLIAHLHETKQDIPKDGTIIDATRPVAEVVDEILDWINRDGLA